MADMSARNTIDFTVSPTSVTFRIGETTASIQLTIKEDTLSEGTETFKLILQEDSITHDELIVSIQDNDGGRFIRSLRIIVS